MVKKKHPNLVNHEFKPGQSGNPSGKPKQLLTKDKLKKILDRFYHMNREELKRVAQDPGATVIELQVASIMVKCIEAGDFSRFEGMLARAIGKVADEIVMPKPMIIQRRNGEEIELTTQNPELTDEDNDDNPS